MAINQTYDSRDSMFMQRDVYGPFNRDKMELLGNLWALWPGSRRCENEVSFRGKIKGDG